MAHPSGFEPETYRLEIGCSIQLSYGCISLEVKRKVMVLRHKVKHKMHFYTV
jgi:hypothetical protein